MTPRRAPLWVLVAVRVLIILAACALLATIAGWLGDGPARIDTTHPPHVERPKGGRHPGTPSPSAAWGADPGGTQDIVLVHDYLQGLQDERERQQVETYLNALEQARTAEAARAAAAARTDARSTPTAPPAPQWPASLYPCGGDLPPCWVKQRESGGNYSAVNRSSGAGGAWQFLPSTWAGYAGYARAELAPPEIQDERARQLWAGGAGCSHWSAC